jgi:cytoskeletal protein CcmA (bactofilin family)
MATAENAVTVHMTTIGASIIIRGRLKVHEDLTVRGRIEAEITSSKALIIENSGIVKANVRVMSAKISGVLVGNITAEEKIEIAADGRVVGDLRAPRIMISDGAAFRGKIEMQGFEEQPQSDAATDSAPSASAPTALDSLPAAPAPPVAVAPARPARTASSPARKH